VDDLLTSDMGVKLVELFEQSKVSHQAVNAHLPKRRSLGMSNGKNESTVSGNLYTNVLDHSQQLQFSQEYSTNYLPDPCVDLQPVGNASKSKCYFLNGDAFSELNNSGSSDPTMMKIKSRKSVHRRDKLCRSRTLRSQAVTSHEICSQISVDTARTENSCVVTSDSDSDDNIRYSLIETNNDKHVNVAKQSKISQGNLDKDVNSRKTYCKVKIENIATKNKRQSGSIAKKRRKPNEVELKSMCFDPEIQFNLFRSSVEAAHGSFKPGTFTFSTHTNVIYN